MDDLVRTLELYGLQIVFVGVLLDQGGLPFPSFVAGLGSTTES